MASVVGIVNSGLSKVGAKSFITSFTDGSPNADPAARLYEPVRDDLLRAHNWNFAVKRAKLAQSSTTPAYEYDYAYALPADWLRTMKVHSNEDGAGDVQYRIEGRFVLSDSNDIYLTYVSQVTDPNIMTADFRELLALALAVEFAIPVANSSAMRERLETTLSKRMRRVRASDAIEDYPERVPDGSWVTSRNGDFSVRGE